MPSQQEHDLHKESMTRAQILLKRCVDPFAQFTVNISFVHDVRPYVTLDPLMGC